MKNLFILFIWILLLAGDQSAHGQDYTYVNGNGRVVSSRTNDYSTISGGNSRISRYKFSKSKERTAEDIPLDFNLEKTEYEYGRLNIWGNIKNKINGRPYEFVKVTFSLWGGRGGTLLAREYMYTDPTTIGPGQIGYIIGYGIECNPEQINLIEYQVTGR